MVEMRLLALYWRLSKSNPCSRQSIPVIHVLLRVVANTDLGKMSYIGFMKKLPELPVDEEPRE
jgi:hypothetical protein